MASLSLADQLEDAIDVMMSKGSPLPREVDPIIDPIIDPIMDPTIGDLLAQITGRILDQFGIEHGLFERWHGPPDS